jgi:hypothetical protein
MKETLVFDMEANGFYTEADEIHCIAIQQVFPDRFRRDDPTLYTVDSFLGIRDAVDRLSKAKLIGHNISGFDVPLIRKLMGVDLRDNILFDTMYASYMMFPDNTWGHSIEAWAEKLHLPWKKTPIDDWSVCTSEMVKRCAEDTLINEAVYWYMQDVLEKKEYFRQNSMEQECLVADIHARQEAFGVGFKKTDAHLLLGRMNGRIRDLRREITAGIPSEFKPTGTPVRKPYTKAGMLAFRTKAYLGEDWLDKWFEPGKVGPFSPVKEVEFN